MAKKTNEGDIQVGLPSGDGFETVWAERLVGGVGTGLPQGCARILNIPVPTSSKRRVSYGDIVQVEFDRKNNFYVVTRVVKRAPRYGRILAYVPTTAHHFRAIAKVLRAHDIVVEGFEAGIAGVSIPNTVSPKESDRILDTPTSLPTSPTA